MPGLTGVNLSSSDPYVNNVLKYTDWPEIAACIAPRPVYIASNSGDNWWPEAGYNKVIWDGVFAGSFAGNGIYIYQVLGGGKMVYKGKFVVTN